LVRRESGKNLKKIFIVPLLESINYFPFSEMLLNLLKLLKTSKICPDRPSKVAGAALPDFQQKNSLIGKIFGRFQNRLVGSGQLSKVLGAAPRNLLSNRNKGFELSRLKSFSHSIAFHTKRLRIY
jgi:hypothetical protein